jgi:hypothetical protein
LNVPIATLEAIAIDTQGARFPLKVSIGTPYQSGNDPATWFCPVAIDPLHRDLRDIAGTDALQALCLGIRLVIDLLRSFVARGGHLTYDCENELPLDSYLFGPSNS